MPALVADRDEPAATDAIITSDLEVFERALGGAALAPAPARGWTALVWRVSAALSALFGQFQGACPNCLTRDLVSPEGAAGPGLAATTLMNHCEACDYRWPMATGDDGLWW